MKKLYGLFVVIGFLFFTGCLTDQVVTAVNINEDALKQVTEVEKLFITFLSDGEQSVLDDASLRIDDLMRMARNNRVFEAKVLGLKGELLYLRGNLASVRSIITQIADKSTKEEMLYLLGAKIAAVQDKDAILEQGFDNAATTGRLQLYRAELLFERGLYNRSVADFDEALIKLPPFYGEYYAHVRDVAYQAMRSGLRSAESIPIISADKVTAAALIRLTLNESKLLNGIVDVNNRNIVDQFKQLYNNRYFVLRLETDNPDMVIMKKKDIAYFLTAVMGYRENNTGLINIYNARYNSIGPAENRNLSPVPDIRTTDYFFSSVLVNVERGITELDDGLNFFPDRDVSGIECLRYIKSAASLYIE